MEQPPPSQAEVSGGCFCGAVRLTVRSHLRAPVNCHCTQCRRLSGAAFTTWFSVEKADLTLTGEANLTTFTPTDNLQRKFCKICGTHVLTLDRRQPRITGLCAGTFEGMAMPRPKGDYFVSDKAPWFTLPVNAKCFGGVTGFEPQTPDPIDAFIGSAKVPYSTDEIMRMTRGDDWNQP